MRRFANSLRGDDSGFLSDDFHVVRDASFRPFRAEAERGEARPVSSDNFGELSILNGPAASTAASASVTLTGERSGTITLSGKPAPGEFPVFPELDGITNKGNNPIARPNSVSELGVPASAYGTIAFGPTATVDGFIVDDSSFDVYQVALTAGETWAFSVYGSGGTPLEDTVVYLFDPNGNFITLDDDGGAGRFSLASHTAAVSGNYFVAVSNFPGLGDLSGGYTLDAVLKPATDVVSDTFAGAELVTPGVTYGFIDGDGPNYLGSFLGEIDTYAIQVEAGKVYTIEVAGGADYDSDFTALVDEIDPLIVVFDESGNFVGLNDDISFPDDINSRFSFIAEEDGTYFFDVMSYDPYTGGFSLTIQELDPADFDPLDSIIWANANNVPFDTNNVAYVYFGAPGENFGELADDGVSPAPAFGWNAFEIQQVMLALDEYEKILGVDYQITTDINQATFRLFTTTSTQFGAYFYPQDPAFGTQQGIGAFNVDSGGWSFDQQQSLQRGGFSFAVILHEFGHGHGLSHPHDTGGGSEVLLGVTSPTGSLGLYDLNQGVYTVMSYNDAWQLHPDGPTPFTAANIDSGWSATLGAFDIAALQQRYGVLNPYATGDDIYVLGDVNDPGTFYETIWDTGGTDAIQYSGARNARVDLLAATIDYTPTGGGVVSFVDDIWGGYTIAEGVVIENATGGDGDDSLLGNAAANVLTGNAGDDILMGRENGDTLNGGAGTDTATYIDADAGVVASLSSNSGSAGDAAGDQYSSIEILEGSQFDDSLSGGNSADGLRGLAGADTLTGGNNDDTLDGGDDDDDLSGGNSDDVLNGGAGNDTLDGGNSNDTLDGGDGDDDMSGGNSSDVMNGGAGDDNMSGGNSSDDMNGGDGNDTLSGGNSGDAMNGGAGDDLLVGGNSGDTFAFTETGGSDQISDFKRGQDLIDVSGLDAIDGGGLDAFAWIGGASFSGAAGELRAYASAGSFFVAGDTNGDLVADFVIQTNVLVGQTDFIF